MARAGECPACMQRFDHLARLPMVSVVCGHSLCAHCLAHRPRPDNASMSSSSSDGEDESGLGTCPVCNAEFGGFVKNFDALAALEAAAPPPPPVDGAPDLGSVVQKDLVIRRTDVQFRRVPTEEIGVGASAVVYRGVYKGRPVAVKCIRTTSDSWANEDRLRRELRNASRLSNEHIVEFRGAAWDHEAGIGSPRNVLLVTELMAGGNLRESLNVLREETGLALESFVHIGLQVTKGIEYLHAEGLAHRDIKSANILLTERLQPGVNRFSKEVRSKIADFGLSKYIDKATGGGTVMQSIMEPGRLEATYAYLAPEAFGGDKSNAIPKNDESDDEDSRYDEMTKKRDIYALGVLFWEMLTGQIPWAGVSLPDVYVRVCVRSDRPGPALDDAKVSKSVRRLVERCWAQNPTRRPSAKSIAAKLEKIAMKIGTARQNMPTTSLKKASVAAAVAAESVSLVSGQVPHVDVPVNPGRGNIPDMHSEPLKDFPADQRDLSHHGQAPSDLLMSYQKMPSASTVYTTHNEGSKTHSTNGFEASETKDVDRFVEDIPGHFEDAVWADDGDSYKNSTGKQAVNLKSSTNGTPSLGNKHMPTTGVANQGVSAGTYSRPLTSTKSQQSVSEALDNGPSSLNRRPSRTRHPGDIPEVLQNRIHPSILAAHYSGVTQTSTPNPTSNTKSNATAVAATAAAIAAAKDRERKRDDVRANRGATPRATRPVNTTCGPIGNTAGDVSFHSLPSAGDGWQRNATKERPEQRMVFYDNSDEEAQDFDPERAAEEEAIARSNGMPVSQITVTRNLSINSRPQPQDAQRSSSMNRVVRPKSPLVRSPKSPVVGRKRSAVGITGKSAIDDELGTSLATSADPVVPKRNGLSVSTSKNRLSRTMSASAQTNAQTRATPVTSPPGVQAALAHSESTGRKAFIRRMRSGEYSRRMGRSTSTTGVEYKRATATQQPTKNSSVISETVHSEEEDPEYTVVQIGASPKEDYEATVAALDRLKVIQLFGQKMAPLRLAGLAHATLISPKHRNEEELLRNSCAALYRLTMPSNSAQLKNSVQETSPKEQLSIRKFLKANQGVEALLQAMYPPQMRHPTTLSYALLALGNLTAWDLDAHKQFRASQGVVQIVQVMKTHRQNVGVQEKGCFALACVGAAYPAKSKGIFQETDALDVVIEVLSGIQQGSVNDAVTKQACAALGALCSSSPSNALYAGRKGALTFLVIAFDRFREASTVDGGKRSEMRLVCRAFIDLLCHAENRKEAGVNGGSTMIMSAMQIFRLDSDFIEKGLATLSEFCTYKSNGMQIVHAGGIDDIVGAMERFRMNINTQKEGCKVLTLLMKATGDQARRRLVHAGGAEAAVLALDRFGVVPDTHVTMVVEVCRSLHILFQMENPSEAEILGRRMRKMKCDRAIKAVLVAHKSNHSVQEKGREALKQLNNLKGGSGLWGRMRGGTKKR